MTSRREIRERIATEIQNAPPIEKVIRRFAPQWAAKRQQARMFMALTGSYYGASRKRGLSEWAVSTGDADTDLLYDLPYLRERSRDLDRNNAIAHGALQTKCLNVIGPGLTLRAQIDRKALSLTEEQADDWEDITERYWNIFWNSPECDICRTTSGPDLEWQVYHQTKVNGDVLIIFPRRQRQGFPFDLKIQVVEADRLCNKDGATDTEELSGGVQKDSDGAPLAYHVLKSHPGRLLGRVTMEWDVIPAYGSTGLRNALHIYRMERPGQSRGIPDLAAIIEPLKQLGRYTEAELEAAVIASFFTVFIKSTNPQQPLGVMEPSGTIGGTTADKDYKLGKGAVLGLGLNEDISIADPGGPNKNFDQFFQSIVQQIGVGLNIPRDVLMKSFIASYSAARAALLEFWKYVVLERIWFARKFNQQVYEIWLYEQVARGVIAAPGFLVDPFIRAAYCGTAWIGPAKGMINENDEVDAAVKRIENNLSTVEIETAQLTGGNWERNHEQRAKELSRQRADGIAPASAAPAPVEPEPEPEPDDTQEEEQGDLQRMEDTLRRALTDHEATVALHLDDAITRIEQRDTQRREEITDERDRLADARTERLVAAIMAPKSGRTLRMKDAQGNTMREIEVE